MKNLVMKLRKPLTDEQIYQNRLRAVDYLSNPKLRKAKRVLRNVKSGGRCCLGHMCDAFPEYIERHADGAYGPMNDKRLPPHVLAELLGLYYIDGGCSAIDEQFIVDGLSRLTLAKLNDETSVKPQQIGQFLKENIKGGKNTPWKAINV